MREGVGVASFGVRPVPPAPIRLWAATQLDVQPGGPVRVLLASRPGDVEAEAELVPLREVVPYVGLVLVGAPEQL